MFAQIVSLYAPLNQISRVREIISEKYLPVVSFAPGFVAAHLLEQIDDRDTAKLVILWKSQSDAESFEHSEKSVNPLGMVCSQVFGLRIERQAYIVSVTTSNILASV